MPKGKYIPLTKEQEQFIKDNYLTIPLKTLGKMLGVTAHPINARLKKWGLEIPKEIILQRKQNSIFKEGSIPPNKGKKQIHYMTPEAIERTKLTRFKKGNTPHNTNYDGHERITKDGYIEIRVAQGKYRLKHIVEWERENGKLPESHCLRCLDGNKLNTNPGNWKLTSRLENMYLNSIHEYPKEIIPSIVLISKINNKLKTIENGKK